MKSLASKSLIDILFPRQERYLQRNVPKGIDTAPSRQDIASEATDEEIIARVPIQNIVAFAAYQPIVAGIAVKRIVAFAA